MSISRVNWLGGLVLLSIATAASGATVVLDGTTATDILDLDVGGTSYNVSFEFDSFADLNVGSNFPFLGDGASAISATNAIVAALNGTSATTAGPSSSVAQALFLVPYGTSVSAINGLFNTTWQNLGLGVHRQIVIACTQHLPQCQSRRRSGCLVQA